DGSDHLGEGAELEVVELEVLARRELARAAPEAVRELAERAELRAGAEAAGELDPQHERPDLRLVVVEAPPLEADDVLLGYVLVPRGDERGQLAEDAEGALVALEALDGISLV